MSFSLENNDKVEKLIKAYEDNGIAVEINALTGQASSGGDGGFRVGDHIEWPDKPKYYEIKMRRNSNEQQRTIKNPEAMVVKVTNNGNERYQMFFPSTLGKSIFEVAVDDEGKIVDKGYVRTKGQAAQDFQNQANYAIQDIMNEMMTQHPDGLVVTKVESIDTYAFGTRFTDKARAVKNNLYTIDYK